MTATMTSRRSSYTPPPPSPLSVWRDRLSAALRLELWVWLCVVGVSFALSPLVSSLRYVEIGATLAALVLVVGGTLRALRLPWPVVVLGQIVALSLAATLRYASPEATLGFLPDRDVLSRLQEVITATFDHAQRFAAPVPRLDELDITLGLSIGVLALVADVIVVVLRRAALVGLVFLAIYVVPISDLSGDVGIWSFVPGAVGYVFLLAAAEREQVVRWGRHLADLDRTATASDAALRGRGLSQLGRRVGLGAVACAVVLPALIPTLPTHVFAPGANGEAGAAGSSDVNVRDPLLDLRRNLRGQSQAELLDARTTSGTVPTYLRMTSLPQLTDAGWFPGNRGSAVSELKSTLPGAPGATDDLEHSTIKVKVKLTDQFNTRWLPVIYAPTKVDVDGAWEVDKANLDIVAANRDHDSSGTSYSFTSRIDEPTADQLRAAPTSGGGLAALLDVPDNLPGVVRSQAKKVTAGAATDYDKAMALQSWFRTDGGFVYDLSTAPGNGMDTMRSFVTNDRRGYCEQFAGAMAIMARTLGIPARVAVGFLRPQQSGSTFVFRGTDMHAWPELYFDGVGWVRFEPTPGGPNYAPATFQEASPSDAQTTAPSATSTSQAGRPDQGKRTNTAASDSGSSSSGGTGPRMLAALGLLLVLLLSVPRVVRAIVSRRRWARATDPVSHAEAAWAELRDRSRDLGIAWDDDATPRATQRALSHRLTVDVGAEAALAIVVGQVERARYARSCEDISLCVRVDEVVEGLRTDRSRRRVLVARWLPISWMRRRHHGRTSSSPDGLIALSE